MFSFHDAIQCLALELDLPDLPEASRCGEAALRIDDVLVRLLPCPRQQGLILRACLGNIAAGDYAAAMERILAGNLFEDGPVHSVLSMDSSGDVYLAQHLSAEPLGAPAFLRTFRHFAARAGLWQQRLRDMAGTTPPALGAGVRS